MSKKAQSWGSFKLVIASLSLSFSVSATPWLDTGDVRLRHNLQILSDNGYLKAPLTTWPLLSEDIKSQLRQAVKYEVLSPAVKSALNYVNAQLKYKNAYSSFKVGGNARTKALLIRDFSGEGREKANFFAEGMWGNPAVDIKVKLSAAKQDKVTLYLFSDYIVDESFASILATKTNAIHPNNSIVRLDESYISSELGNWKFTAGQQSRWWGPSWDGSLILSNNARPIPSISLENIHSQEFESKFFNWIGPNKFHLFIGKLEEDREISNPTLFGFRYNFRPKLFKNFEVGLSRMLTWGGKGQNKSLSGLSNALFGLNSNVVGDRLLGNTQASIDMRWKLPLDNTKNNYSLYGQYHVEDTGNSIFGGNEILQLGGSISGYSEKLNGSWRSYLELSDTSSGVFSGKDRNNTTYNHGFYLDGYRHLGVSMGHGIDSDSTLFSLGTILSTDNGDLWRAWIKIAELDLLKTQDGQNPISDLNGKKWTAMGISLDKQFTKKTNLKVGSQLITEKPIGEDRSTKMAVSVGVSHQF